MRGVAVVVVGIAVASSGACHGGSSGSAGAAGSGGAAGQGGNGVPAGSAGAGGAAGQGGSGGGQISLPACAITTRPQDPGNDGGPITQAMVCNSLTVTGDWIVPETFTWGDGGVASDGGAVVAPAGGTILNGDYDLVRFQVPASGQTTRRSIRVFDGGAYIEWAVDIQNPSVDGGLQEIWYDTAGTPSGPELRASSVCNAVGGVDAYTADGDTLTFFVFLHDTTETPIGIDTYRRTCAR